MAKQKCVLCGKAFEGFGNNPAPLKQKGRCCNTCNCTKVIAARLRAMREEEFVFEATALTNEEQGFPLNP